MDFETPLVWEQQLLSPKYTEPIPVSNAKKKDFMYLLKAGVIPEAYMHFVTGIPSSRLARDIVPYVVEEEEGIESLTEATKKKKGRRSKTDVKGKKPEKELSKETKKTKEPKKPPKRNSTLPPTGTNLGPMNHDTISIT
ncbi:hypothetical protein J6590_097901 [Homalodisca vitripennis]|nr:hypothetical protein J6590_097901 [Homalodisca vitripennis]